MLGNDVLSVRLGGIYALQDVWRESIQKQYHVWGRSCTYFCAFVRHPTKDNAGESAPD